MSKILIKNWPILVIIILAAFLRLFKIDQYMEFLGDQGRDVVIVRSFLKEGNIFTIGPVTSIGNMYLGPFYYYLFVVPGLILTWFNPVGPSIIVALLGVFTVYLIYSYSKKWFGQKSAYMAAFLYAISPVIIKYSNFSWNPNIMPLFALLFFNFCLESNFILATIAFIICLNSHYLSLLLVPVGGLIFIYQYYLKPKLRSPLLRQLLISLIIFILSLTPQVLFDLKHNGQNFKALTNFFTYRETTVNLKAYKAIPQISPLFLEVNTRLLAGKNVQLGILISIIFILLIVQEFYRQYKTKKFNPYFNWLFIWLSIGLVGLALYKQHIYDHYFGFIYPVVFILFSYLLSKTYKLFTIIILVSLTIFSIIENPFRWNPPKQMATTFSIDQSIIKEASSKPFNFALLAKMNYDPGYRYFLSELNAPVKLLQDQITDQLFVVCEPFQIDCNPINNPEWSVAAFGWAKIDKQWEINGIKIFKLSHTQ